MIKKIKKIHYKSFNDYEMSVEFTRINLIYGLNGKGKSSFVQFLKNNINDKNNFECSQDDYKIFSYDELYKRDILWINDDNKEDSFGSFYAGEGIGKIMEDKKKIIEKIKKAEEKIKDREKSRQNNTQSEEYLKTNIAKKTREILQNIDPQKYKNPQSYSKSHIELKDIDNINVLSDDKFDETQKYKMDKKPHTIQSFKFDKTKQLLKQVSSFKEMLLKNPENQAIERFKQDPELESLARIAIELRKKYPQDYNEKCPLCEQSILQIRLWENLEKHFNQEYQNFIKQLNESKVFFQDIREELNSFKKWIKQNFIQAILLCEGNVDNLRQKYLDVEDMLQENLQIIVKTLEEKSNMPNENNLSLNINDNDFSNSINELLKELEIVVEHHNEKRRDYEKIIEENIINIKQHFIAKEKDNFLRIRQKIKQDDRYISRIKEYISCCENTIHDLDEELKNMDKSFEKLNGDLNKWFFEDIRFDKISDSHYRIQRQNFNREWIDCKSGLSEGEKTIVSLIYFINYYLAELENLKECPIVIIDDPITSLDSQNKDKIVNYIMNKIISSQNKGQFFILSHDKTILFKINKMLNAQNGQNKQVFELNKLQLASELKRLKEIKLGNDIKAYYTRLEEYIKNESMDNAEEIGDTIRKLLEGLNAIVFKDDSNFTNCYNKLLKNLGMEERYTASDIQDLNHNKNSEDKTPEVVEKCRFVVEVFEKFIHKSQN